MIEKYQLICANYLRIIKLSNHFIYMVQNGIKVQIKRMDFAVSCRRNIITNYSRINTNKLQNYDTKMSNISVMHLCHKNTDVANCMNKNLFRF